MDEFKGLKVPIADLPSAVKDFNSGKQCWCACASRCTCACASCILCCNAGNPAEKIKAFGDYAISKGHVVTRAEYLAMNIDYAAGRIAVDVASADDVDDDDDRYTCTCRYCEEQFKSDDEDAELCPDCKHRFDDGEIRTCDRCGKYFNTDDGIIYTEDSNEVWCYSCSDYAYRCDACGNYYEYEHNIHSDDNFIVCDHCYDRSYYTCNGCRCIVHENDTYWHDDEPYCESCCPDDSDVIHNYWFKPDPDFWECDGEAEADKGKLIYLGFELECGDGDSDRRNRCAELIDNTTSLCYLKGDGSIPDYGFEMVTHPLTYLYHKDCAGWDDILKIIRGHGLKSHDASSSCGLHVHVNRNSLNDHRWLIVDWFVHRFQSKWETIARRSDEHWCAFKRKDSFASLKDVYGKGYERHSAINFKNRNTVEFRLFRGTLRYETLIGTLALVDGLIRWARIVKVHDLLTRGIWESYIKFLKSDERYALGVEYLRYRGIITD